MPLMRFEFQYPKIKLSQLWKKKNCQINLKKTLNLKIHSYSIEFNTNVKFC